MLSNVCISLILQRLTQFSARTSPIKFARSSSASDGLAVPPREASAEVKSANEMTMRFLGARKQLVESEEDELSITSALASDVNYFQKHLDRANFEAHPKFCIHQRGVPPNLGLSVLGCIDAQFLQNLAALKKSRNNRTEKRISPQKMQVFEPQSWPSLLERERYSS